jgi:RNA polymerase sigma-70 factor (ECF subfamily)
LDLVEDAVQAALLSALEHWTVEGLPEHPPAWLYRVAFNELIGSLRLESRRQNLLARHLPGVGDAGTALPEPRMAVEIEDDLLRMLFVCCDTEIPAESQLVLALKTLCGFSVREIALRLFSSEASVYKRLERARQRLRDHPPDLDWTPVRGDDGRLAAVHRILYLLFTEGHLSSDASHAIRRELCEEALRLGKLLANHPVGQVPETFALLALMYLHLARLPARQDGSGGLLLLEEQERSRWDQSLIREGLGWLERSASGERFSRFHAEAGIAAEHCLAPSFPKTRWDRIAACYELLEEMAPSPMHSLNRAVAIAEWQGPQAGLAVLRGLDVPAWLRASYLWSAVSSDLHGRCGDRVAAERYRDEALTCAPTAAVRQLLERRLGGRRPAPRAPHAGRAATATAFRSA